MAAHSVSIAAAAAALGGNPIKAAGWRAAKMAKGAPEQNRRA
jgi:hypothetical protein